ncbi:MAG: hypothetical protein HUJ90_01340 [Bacteroidales bacterium]|nr:hypothetical protein [Bacteroidales bacterium]
MKKVIFLLIALFYYGSMCKAQPMHQTSIIANQDSYIKTGNAATAMQKAPVLKSEAATTTYMLRAQNQYRDAGGYLVFDYEGYEMQWPVSVAIDGNLATIKGLINLENSGYDFVLEADIVGKYEADNHRIVIDTPTYERGKDVSEYTQVGTTYYWGDEAICVLFTGNYEYDPDYGEYGLETKGRLIFDINEEDGTLTANYGFGAALFSGSSYCGFACFFADATFKPFAKGKPMIVTTPTTMDETSKFCYPGQTFSYPVRITNASDTNANLTIQTSDAEALSAEVETVELAAGASIDTNVNFTPQAEGAYNATIYINDGAGNTTQVPFIADVKPNPGYDQVVTEGEFSFTTTSEFPFLVTDEITGKPAAVSTNSGDNTISSLFVHFTVPEGCTGVVTWKGAGYATMPNSFTCYLDQEFKVSVSNMDQVGYEFDESYAVEAGEHVLEFHNAIYMDWHQMYDDPEIRFYLTELALVVTTEADDAASLNPKTLEFGKLYYDCLDVITTKNVYMLNIGRNDLKVLSITSCDNFTGIVPETSAETLESIEVPIVFTGTGVGEFTGDVVITTTAGDFTLNCKATCEQIIYDYQPIVKKGVFSFNTSVPYPFAMKGNLAYSTIGKNDFDILGIPCWLEATFEVPEGKVALLEWDGYNSSWDYFYWMDEPILTDGTIIYIDNDEVAKFASETSISSDKVTEDVRILEAGRHTVRFEYIRKSSEYYSGDDLVEISSLSYTEASSVNDIKAEGEIVDTKWYTIGGVELNNAPQSGFAIKVDTYANGVKKHTKTAIK